MKKLISFFLCAAITLCLFTACQKAELIITETEAVAITAAEATVTTSAEATILTTPTETAPPETEPTTTAEIIAAEAETKAETATTSPETTPAVFDEAVYAIDKINIDPLPEGSMYLVKYQNGLTIISDAWECNISGANNKDQFRELDEYAKAAMASLVMNYKYESADLMWGDPINTTVADYDAVLYSFFIEEAAYVTDENGSNSGRGGRQFTGRAYFFYSGTDAYYLTFTCQTKDYEDRAEAWDQIIANVKVDENLKLADVTTVNAQFTNTEK
jgi:hypothetical protein